LAIFALLLAGLRVASNETKIVAGSDGDGDGDGAHTVLPGKASQKMSPEARARLADRIHT